MSDAALSEKTRKELLGLARGALEAHFRGDPPPRLGSDRAEGFGQPRGIFVTLRRNGELRGCIGTLSPEGNLSQLVPEFSLRAALEDPRFPPLELEELSGCEIEISLLTAPRLLEDPESLEIGRDGLIIEAQGRRGLLLPQVATQWGFDRDRFLREVCRKAGLGPEAWRDPATRVWSFSAEVFSE